MFFEYDTHAGFELPAIHFTSDAFIAGAGTGDSSFRDKTFTFTGFQPDVCHGEIIGIIGNYISPCREYDIEIFRKVLLLCLGDVAIYEFIFLGETQEMDFGTHFCNETHHIEVKLIGDISCRMPAEEAHVGACINN
jgi:hypothetical protein